MTYTPTEQQLLKMGFEKKGTHYVLKGPKIQHRIIQYYVPGLHQQPGFFFECDYIYPRSKEHLEQIILGFSKP